MSGAVFRRCRRCGRRAKGRACPTCGPSSLGWAFVVDVGDGAGAKRVQRLRTGFATKAEADRALLEVRTSLDKGTYVERSTLTVAEYLTEWLEATGPPRVKHETWNDRQRNLETHVVPRIGGITLQQLTSAHLNLMYRELLQAGRVDGAGGLSPTSVRRIHAMLRKALRDAARWKRLERNPADLADPPTSKTVHASGRRSMQTWSEQDLRRFLDRTAADERYPMWFFAASTGVRRSELLGLRWSDVDLAAGLAHVRQTVVPGADGYQMLDDQKTASSARTLHLDARTVGILRGHRDVQSRRQEVQGPAWQDHDLLFPRHDGRWWNPPAISIAFRRAVERSGVPRVRLHDLRHTHATLLLSAGVNPKVVSERLGHSSVSFTLDTYAHVLPGMQPDAAERFMGLAFGPAQTRPTDPQNPEEET